MGPERLTGRSAFQSLLDEGRRVRVESLQASVRYTGNPARVGYAIPKSLGKAVSRNRLRRRMREMFRLLPGALPPVDIVVRPRASAFLLGTEALQNQVQRLATAIAAMQLPMDTPR